MRTGTRPILLLITSVPSTVPHMKQVHKKSLPFGYEKDEKKNTPHKVTIIEASVDYYKSTIE